MSTSSVRVTVTTAATAGAVAIVQLHGPGALNVLQQLTGVSEWPLGRLRLTKFHDIDEGLAATLRDDWVQLMPHGGPRVVQKLVDHLLKLGAVYESDPPARELYPEASSELEADMLATLARVASPAAIDLLLAQPQLWREYLTEQRQRAGPSQPRPVTDVLTRTVILNRLITPPTVVVVGRPNVGKSTLTNRMLGRTASIVADLPGTTRDWVAGLAEIRGVAVRWLDTPGIRESSDPIEREAIELARKVIDQADVLIAMRDSEIDWPVLERRPDIRVMNKCDKAAMNDGNAIRISAATGIGVDQLEQAVLHALGFGGGAVTAELWAFSQALREMMELNDWEAMAKYAGLSDR